MPGTLSSIQIVAYNQRKGLKNLNRQGIDQDPTPAFCITTFGSLKSEVGSLKNDFD